MAERLDIILFGASGFTGLHCIPYIVKLSKKNGANLKWGVAGRSEQKLKDVLKTMGEKLETSLDTIPIIIADVNDYDTLLNMAKRTKLIINCCGPFRFFGDIVVKASLEGGAHHVDVSGEPEYMERIQIEQHDTAVEKGLYAISACGFDCIPSEMGIVFTQQKFEGTLNNIESYLYMSGEDDIKGPAINYGTWESLVQSVSNVHKLAGIRKRLIEKFKKVPSIFKPKIPAKRFPHYVNKPKGWAIPFVGADNSVARRTQHYFYYEENQRPVQVGSYMIVESLLNLILLIFFGLILLIMSRFKFGQQLLLDYPSLFSGGFFSKTPPTEERIKNTVVTIDFHGKGWKEKLVNKDDQYKTPMDRYIVTRVTGRNPGYGVTCFSLVIAAIIILTEKDKMANNGKGGIYPPGAAFAKTSIIEQLNENGLSFEIVAQGDL